MPANWRLSRSEFEDLVEEAIRGLPRTFRRLLDNIAVMVEDEPDDEDYEEHGIEDDSELLGVFRGIPLTRRHYDELPALPNQVVIFRGPILRCARTREEAIDQVRETVVHELGHYFGLSDDEMVY